MSDWPIPEAEPERERPPEACGDKQTVNLSRYYATDLRCQRQPGHDGKHRVTRWFGIVCMRAEWT